MNNIRKAQKLLFITLTFLYLSFLVSCGHSNQFMSERIPVLVPGFTTCESFNEDDKPGKIIRSDSKGTKFTVQDLELPGITKETPSELPKYTKKSKFKIGVLIDFLKADKTGVSAGTGFNRDKTFDIELELIGAKKEYIEGVNIPKRKIKNALQEYIDIKGNEKYRNDKFSIIRESIKADGILFHFEKNVAWNQELEFQLKNIFKAEEASTGKDKEQFHMEKRFDKPLYIYYKEEELSLSNISWNIFTGYRFILGGNEKSYFDDLSVLLDSNEINGVFTLGAGFLLDFDSYVDYLEFRLYGDKFIWDSGPGFDIDYLAIGLDCLIPLVSKNDLKLYVGAGVFHPSISVDGTFGPDELSGSTDGSGWRALAGVKSAINFISPSFNLELQYNYRQSNLNKLEVSGVNIAEKTTLYGHGVSILFSYIFL
jgi:hypothetical protein